MSDFPWYMRGYWFVLETFVLICLLWLFKGSMAKFGRKTIDMEKYYAGILELLHKYDQTMPPLLSGKEAIRMGRVVARVGDLVFWLVLFSVLIFTISQFENIFM